MRNFGNDIKTHYGQITIQPPTAGGSGLVVNNASGTSALTVASTGNVTVSAPTSSTSALSIAGNGGANAVAINANGYAGIAITNPGVYPGLEITGTASSGYAYIDLIDGQAGNVTWQLCSGYPSAGVFSIVKGGGATAVQIGTNGNVTVNAPTSGVPLTVNAVAGSVAASFVGASSGTSDGLAITAGQVASDIVLLVRNVTGTPTFLEIFGDGGVVVGNPTGGDQGLGTINATGLYVNGVAVSGGYPQLKTVIVSTGTSRTSTATLTNDAQLTYAIPATGTYRIRVTGVYTSTSSTPGVTMNLNYSGTITSSILTAASPAFTVGSESINYAGQILANNTNYSFSGTTGSSTYQPFTLDAILVAGSTGTVAVGWAQFSSSATAVNFVSGTTMTVERLA